ncbi:phosphoribosylanthranilate isomerase [Thalassobius sp. Cn5-15]|jgi:phosphoribosylanthranilate isomerase|uniref:phosphoribosylanthranilate isomerase n=1 Tax=Thalassobius sp. Cn5-15 TaxID=2917763 RepID=UPI001EF27A6F|nr:phosphoribosylanthranilate isomerase [Thalassobius sp. Cn5-15]MCG7493327.1 phosphoribosylanthranilate isomerase [Thalassobius sp. Cn5-15]
MPQDTKVKICGLRQPDHVELAGRLGAAYVGFVFFPKSPRNVSVAEARELAWAAPVGLAKVALVVNADDATLDAINDDVAIDMWQLHGSESPERVAEVKARYGLPVMKAVGIATEADVVQIDRYSDVADQLLIDAKAPKGADLPGGNGLSFDWQLVKRKYWSLPWMLAGGLTPDNVGRAQNLTGARQVDVSSGVETAPGVKDPALMDAFLRAALA